METMHKRVLREIDPSTFKSQLTKATPLASALDDGFRQVERDELYGRRLLLVTWELRPGVNHTKDAPRWQAQVWAMAERETGDAEKVKFSDAGYSTMTMPGIPDTLKALQDNGTTTNVLVVMPGEDTSGVDFR